MIYLFLFYPFCLSSVAFSSLQHGDVHGAQESHRLRERKQGSLFCCLLLRLGLALGAPGAVSDGV